MTDNEKLIAEIATDAANSVGGYARPGYATYDAAERAARAALEKAHTPKVVERHDLVMPIYEEAATPTDDEREVLIQEWANVHQGPDAHAVLLEMLPIGDQMSLALRDALRELAALRRGSDVPEPSAEESHLIDQAWSFRNQVSDSASPGSLVDLWLRTAAALEARVKSPEPQGDASDARFGGIVREVIAEAERSIAKHGEQGDLPMGTGPETYPLRTDGPAMFDTLPAEDLAEIATADTKFHSRNEGGNDTCTWWHILREEVFEAAAESEPRALREELVQVATVAVKMIDALDATGGVR